MPAKSERQRRFFGLVLAIQRGTAKGASAKAKKVASTISSEDAVDFAGSVKKKREGISRSLSRKR